MIHQNVVHLPALIASFLIATDHEYCAIHRRKTCRGNTIIFSPRLPVISVCTNRPNFSCVPSASDSLKYGSRTSAMAYITRLWESRTPSLRANAPVPFDACSRQLEHARTTSMVDLVVLRQVQGNSGRYRSEAF